MYYSIYAIIYFRLNVNMTDICISEESE